MAALLFMTRKPVVNNLLGVSKGYAFLVCSHPRTQSRILAAPKHEINGRVVEVTEAIGKLSKTTSEGLSKSARRLFVGGLPESCTNGTPKLQR